ncbi:hypothetical protein Tco_0387988, partial [Tanacetum coccineum]
LASTKQSNSSAQITEQNSSTKLCLNTMKVVAYFIKSLFRELLNKMAGVVERRNRTLVGSSTYNDDILESSHVSMERKL